MNTTVTFRHLPSSDALKDHCEKKAEKLTKYLQEPIDLHVVLDLEKNRQVCEITVNSKHFRTHSREASQDMYSSIDLAFHKLETQLRRHKEKVKDHKATPSGKIATEGNYNLPA